MKNKCHLMLCVLMALSIFPTSPAIGGTDAPDKAVPRTSKSKRVVSLPKVLIIGDSISGGYSKSLTKLLDGKAEVVKLGAVAGYRIQKEAFWHSRGTAKNLDFASAKACIADFERFEKYLKATKYDLIHFNFGLNDIFRGRKGTWLNPVDQYAKDLTKIVTLLKKNGAKVIWASTTPIPANDPYRPEGEDLIYNAAAEKVMKKNNIPINDLHSVVTHWDGYGKWKNGDNVHFGGAVYSKLAKQIADVISVQLETQLGSGKHLFILSGQSNMVGLDPSLTFTPAVASALGKSNIIVVKDAHSGQSIRSWCKSNHEFPPPTTGRVPKVRGLLYESLMKKVQAAIEGETIGTITFVWMQGESDLNNTAYDVYLKELLKQLQEDLKFKDINFVIGRISDCGLDRKKRLEGKKYIRRTQVQFAESYPRGAWVDTDDLNDRTEGDKVVHDLHYTADGYKLLGQRFAEQAVRVIRKAE